MVTREGVLADLAGDLSRTQSGIGFIYAALDRLVDHHGLQDAFVVLDEPAVGRQTFRAGRKPPDGQGGVDPLALPAGLYTTPPLNDDTLEGAVVGLCHVALQLDLTRHDASHDPLTGLYNRRSFDAMLRQSAFRSARYGWRFVLAVLDVNRFKVLNDQLGHGAGDQILRTVGTELRSSLRGGDAAARIGGDEFALLLHNGDQRVLNVLLERIQLAVANSVGVEVGFSAGTATAPDDSSDPEAIYHLADQRLYESKRR